MGITKLFKLSLNRFKARYGKETLVYVSITLTLMLVMLVVSLGYIWPMTLVYVQILLTLALLVLFIRLLYLLFNDLFDD